MRPTIRIVPILILLLASITATAAVAEHIRYQGSSRTGASFELTIESETPAVLTPLPVVIEVLDPEGRPVTGAQIICSLTMPAMAMPTNKPPIKETGQPGQYEGIFLLTMGGLWNAELTVTYASGQREIVVIPIPGVVSRNKLNDIDAKLEDLFQEQQTTQD